MPFVSDIDNIWSNFIKWEAKTSLSETFGYLGFKVLYVWIGLLVLHSVNVPQGCTHFLSDNLKKVGSTNGIYSLFENQIFLSVYCLSILIVRHSLLGLCAVLLVMDI